jgi:hypothetical protein
VSELVARPDRRRWVAIGAAALIAVVGAASVAVFARVGPWQWADWVDTLGYTFWISAFTAVGVLIAFHRPGNPIAWICLGFSAVWSFWVLGESMLFFESSNPGSLRRPDLLAALAHPLWVPGVGLIGYLLLLFPDGHLASPRWRPVARVLGGTMALLTLTGFFLPGLVQDTVYPNPLGIEVLEPFDQGAAGFALVITLVLCILASAVSVVIRYRRASGNERLQLKWLMAAGLVAALAYPLIFFLGDFDVQLVWALIPIAIGLSMHRHRLYDIDRLISRTVVYTVVVGVVALVFIGVIFVFQEVLGAEGPIGVAGSTLASAAVFNPLRRKVQERVDRRFNRSRFDARRVAEGFAGDLANETDAGRIVDGWLQVVSETLQPTLVGVWVSSRH